MNKEQYQKAVAVEKAIIKGANETLNVLREQFIDDNKPCEKGEIVEIILKSGRKVKGEAVSFGILQDKNVHVTAYKNGSQTKYISVPNISVNVIQHSE